MRSLMLLVSLFLFYPVGGNAANLDDPENAAFASVPELMSGFRMLYIQKFPEGRAQFAAWAAQHPNDPFGQVAIAASYLFEEFYHQGVLTSEFFLNDKTFLNGIEGKPDPERMQGFDTAIENTRKLATQRLEKNPEDPEALYALTLAAGMDSDADMILRKHRMDALKSLKEANLRAKDLLAERPEAADVYIALGAANYIIGSLSVGFRAMLWFGGIHGDKKLGMEQVAKTVEGGLYLKPFAKIMLALAARREKENNLAQKLLHELVEEFPESPLYPIEYAKAMGRPVPSSMHR